MIEGKKISELASTTLINDACCFPILAKGATRKITFAILLENIISNLQIPNTQEIQTLKNEVAQLTTDFELTEEQIATINAQIEELQQENETQETTINKYTKIVQTLQTAYENATISGGVVDNELNEQSVNPVQNKIIAQLIPEQASEENKLADKDFVNSSVSTNTAEFIGTFNSLQELKNTTKSYDNNDYAFVVGTDSDGNTQYNRYKWNGSEWVFEYVLNNSSFTSEQWKAINSDVTLEWKNDIDLKTTQFTNPIDDTQTSENFTWSSSKINTQTANRQVKIFDNSNSATGKWYKICSASTFNKGCNIKLTASRADSTATVQYFSALFRNSKYRYTSSYLMRERTVYEQELAEDYSFYIVADANNEIWVHVPSYGYAIIEVNLIKIIIDGTEGTPVTPYVYNSFDYRDS